MLIDALVNSEHNWDDQDSQIANFLYDQSTPVSHDKQEYKKMTFVCNHVYLCLPNLIPIVLPSLRYVHPHIEISNYRRTKETFPRACFET